jgi:hypothetical protein
MKLTEARRAKVAHSVRLANLACAVGFAVLCGDPTAIAQPTAQGIAACPLPGTIVEARDTIGDYTVSYRGVDPEDDSVCISDIRRPGRAWKEVRTTYGWINGWFNLTRFDYPSSSRRAARDALAGVLNGTITATEFDQPWGNRVTRQPGKASFVLVRTGNETLAIGATAINAITLRVSAEGNANSKIPESYFSNDWDLWYDPESHLFVKGHVTNRRGAPQILDFVVVSITLPSPAKAAH